MQILFRVQGAIFKGLMAGLAAVLIFSSGAAQSTTPAAGARQRPSKFGNDPGGPAPKRELTGVWAGSFGGGGPTSTQIPPLTPLGQARFKLNKPDTNNPLANDVGGDGISIAETNDPWKTSCDPLGFPRAIMEETRAFAFTQMADRVVELFQYQHVWREIYTDGRALPTNVGAKDGPDPRYYGYSVGHWTDDSTFVVDTVGLDDQTWIGGTPYAGYPHSIDMHVTETYQRTNHNNLQLSVVMDDPKIYTKPVTYTTAYKWIPSQEWEEQLCIPSQIIAYQRIIGLPAGPGSVPKK
jgi:hypothetical protein